MKTGTTVRVVQPPPIQGEVMARRINPQSDDVELLVQWQEADQAVQRWFTEEQLQEVTK